MTHPATDRNARAATPMDMPFEAIVEAAPNAIFVVDGEGRILLVNRKGESLFGYSRQELLGRLVEILVPGEFERFLQAGLTGREARAAAPPTETAAEMVGRRKDGSEVAVEMTFDPIKTPTGVLTLVAVADIRERLNAQAAHARLAAIVESSDDAIVGKSLGGVITSWNAGAERLFGFTAAQAIGQPTTILFPERLIDEEVHILEMVARNERVEPFETVRRRRDQTEVQVSVTVSPLRNSRGEVIGASSISRDITELKRRDAELRRSNTELEQFAYVASHDLQEPLRMVANFTELLSRRYTGQLDERADKYLHYAHDGARRMQQLVADLLAYSRVESQGKPLAAVQANVVVDRVVRSLRPALSKVAGRVETGPLPTVLVDEVQLGQLFQNLIGNAIKFRGADPPRISIAADRVDDRWQFSVADNGMGIESRYAERIFQMFQRLHERGAYEGSGIGLTIAKNIVERHGGTIWMTSEPGAGATFFFTLLGAKDETE